MKTARNISAYEGHDSNDSLYFKMNYPYNIWTEKCSEVIDHKLIGVYPRILIYYITKRKKRKCYNYFIHACCCYILSMEA